MTALGATSGLRRGPLFAAFLATVMVNVAFTEGMAVASRDGWALAVLSAFGVSAIVWFAQAAAVIAMLRAAEAGRAEDRPDGRDLVVLAVGTAMALAPLAQAAMAGQALACAHLILRGGALRAPAVLGFMVTLPMLWGSLFLVLFSDAVLAIDAQLVAAATGGEVIGNLVSRADQSGYVKISQPCSSLSNISLALLCWALFLHLFDRRYGGYRFVWALAVVAPVVAINVARIGAIALRPDLYEVIHGETGAGVAGLVTLLAIVGMCYLGVQRDDAELHGADRRAVGPDAGAEARL